MAITVTLRGSATTTTASGASSMTIPSVSLTNGAFYVAFVCTSAATAPTITGITATGLAMTKKTTTGDSVVLATRLIEVWYGNATATGTVTVTCGLSAACNCQDWAIFEIGGVDNTGTNGVNAIVQAVGKAPGAATSITFALATFGSTDNRPLATCVHASNEGTTDPDGVHTELVDGAHDLPNSGLCAQWHPTSAFTATRFQWATSVASLSIAVELKSSAAASPIVGTAACVFGQAGTVTGSGALAASCPLTFSQTAARSATGALATSTPVVFGHLATRSATGALASSAPLVFGHAAVLGQLVAIAGSGALTFGQSGSMVAIGSIAAVAPLTFGQNAVLGVVGGGACAMAFGQAATLSGSTALAASCPLAFSQSALLKGTAALASSTPVTFAQAGALRGTAAAAISVPVIFGHAATARATGALASVTPVAFSHVPTLRGSTALAATSALAFSSVPALKGLAPAAGAAALTFGHAAVPRGTAALATTAPLTFGSVALGSTLSDFLSAVCTLRFTAELAVGRISGTAVLVFGSHATLTAKRIYVPRLGYRPQPDNYGSFRVARQNGDVTRPQPVTYSTFRAARAAGRIHPPTSRYVRPTV